LLLYIKLIWILKKIVKLQDCGKMQEAAGRRWGAKSGGVVLLSGGHLSLKSIHIEIIVRI
jgi:hypothetical protein